MNIGCYLLNQGQFEATQIPEEILIDLCKSLRTNGVETVHFADRSIMVDGIFVPAKGSKNTLMVVPNVEE